MEEWCEIHAMVKKHWENRDAKTASPVSSPVTSPTETPSSGAEGSFAGADRGSRNDAIDG